MIHLLALALAAEPDFDADVKRAVSDQQQCDVRGRSETDDVVVCGRRRDDERYRMPGRNAPFDPAGNVMSVARERMAWGEGGASGIGSCGPVGPGGWTGCIAREQERQRTQYQWGKNVPRKW